MLTEAQIQQIVASATAEIEEAAKEEVKRAITDQMTRAVETCIRDSAAVFLREHVQPKIVKKLADAESAIIEAAVRVASEAGKALANGMIDDVKAKMKNSWDRKKILSAMFGT